MDLNIIIHKIIPHINDDIQRFKVACICKHVLNSYIAMNPNYDKPYKQASCLRRMMAFAKRSGAGMVSWSFAIDFTYNSTSGKCFTIEKRSSGKYINSIVYACHMTGDVHTNIVFRTEEDVIQYFCKEFLPYMNIVKLKAQCRYKSMAKKQEFEALNIIEIECP